MSEEQALKGGAPDGL